MDTSSLGRSMPEMQDETLRQDNGAQGDQQASQHPSSDAAGLHLSAHDLRRTFTTIGIAMCRLDILKVELLTNHKPKSVTAKHYLETKHLQYLLPEVQAIADWIMEQGRIYEAITTGQNVVALRA